MLGLYYTGIRAWAIIRKPATPARKLVILGDTYDPSPIIPLCTAPSLLIHEAADAHIPCQISPRNKRTPESVLRSTLARGHSIPSMASEFARTISAEKLVLNHIGGRFPAPRRDSDRRMHVMREMEQQATDAWGSGQETILPPAASKSHPRMSSLKLEAEHHFVALPQLGRHPWEVISSTAPAK
ncbi:hypothetical protein B0H14DRAFT_2564684 [Mycena olivaceomarginata]|nr:hypothetical protein B0H14DRAFT_2564684 [Mycena olivaceomarginata]